MIRTDMFTIATSGLNASQGLLNTTSNNIANVNTEGYTRQRAIVNDQETGGVLLGDIERVVNRFAQEQSLRDKAGLGEADKLVEKLEQLDTIFASEAISAAEGMSRYFAALQTATDEPNNMAARQTVLAQSDAMSKQFQSLDGYLETSARTVNEEMEALITQANTLIQTVNDLNIRIKENSFATQTSASESLKDQRDTALSQLATLVEIDTRVADDGSTLVFMSTGQSLVLEDGTFNLFGQNGNPDPQFPELTLQVPDDADISVPLGTTDVGGEIGGLLRYRNDVLEINRRELGQISLALSDAMNEQNKLGMDLDGDLGVDLFNMPSFTALPYDNNASQTARVNARVPDGGGADISSADYQLTVTAVAGATITVDIALLNPDGSPLLDNTGAAVVQSATFNTVSGTFEEIPGGTIGPDLELEFPDAGTYAVDDQFLIQPARSAAGEMRLAVNRAEDFALAAPVRLEAGNANLGSATLESLEVTNTTIGSADPTEDSAFVLNAGGRPELAANAPVQIYFTAADSFEVRNAAGATIVTVNNAPNLDNIMTQAAGAAGWPFGGQQDYPGYNFSIKGTPRAGDSFTMEFNTNGFNDNTNGLKLSALQGEDKLLQSDAGNGSAITFHEAYATMVNDIGSKTQSAKIELDAAVATDRLSTDWVNSISGVSLDEEAANLVRFQQAYSASARVLSTAQSLFQTILQSLG